MTAYNRENFIAEAIESVLSQSYHNFELIILDDCSNDKTVEIIERFANSDTRVKYFINEKNIGDYPNRNKAASLATGDFIMYVDSDDSIKSNAIAYIVESFRKYPTALHSAIYYESDLIDPSVLCSDFAIRNHYFKNNSLAGGPGSRVFKKQFFDELGGYPEKYGPANDMYFNVLTTSKAPILMLPYPYLNYRIHDSQEKNNEFAYLYNGYNYLNNLISEGILELSKFEIKKLNKGNKRRFLINSLKLFLKNKDTQQIVFAFKRTDFGRRDFINSLW